MAIYYGHDSDVGRFIIDSIPPWSTIKIPTDNPYITNSLSNELGQSVIVTEEYNNDKLNNKIKLGIAEGNYTRTNSRDSYDDAVNEARLIKDIGSPYVKKYISWNDVQPTPAMLSISDADPNSNAYNWNIWGNPPGAYDDIQIAIDEGLKVILVVKCNQLDAIGATNDKLANFPTGVFGSLSGLECWKRFLRAIITRYGANNIYAWEIHDEVDLNWIGSLSGPTSYGSLVAESKIVLNQYAGQNILAVSLSSTDQNAQNFFYQPLGSPTGILLDAKTPSGTLLFEVLDLHLTSDSSLSNTNKSQFDNLLAMAPIVPGTKLKYWSTEFKISSTMGLYGGDQLNQARNMIKKFIELYSEGWDLILNSYAIDDNEYNGLLFDDTDLNYPYFINAKLSYEYFKEFVRVINNSTYLTKITLTNGSNTAYAYQFRALGRSVFYIFGNVGTYYMPDQGWNYASGKYLIEKYLSLNKIGTDFEVDYNKEDIFFVEQLEINELNPRYLNVVHENNGLLLSWDEASGCNAYNIYKAKKGETLQLLTSTSLNFYLDEDVILGESYNYYVKSMKVIGLGNIVLSGEADDDLSDKANSGLDKVELLITKGSNTSVVKTNIQSSPNANMNYDWEYTWFPTEEGEYFVQSRATDLAGNVEGQDGKVLSYRTIIVDATGPNIQFDNPVSDYTKTNSMIEIKGKAWDNLTGISNVEMTIDGVQINLNIDNLGYKGTPANWSALWVPENDGEHTVIVKAYDLAGNVSYAITHILSDTTKPWISCRYVEGNVIRSKTVTVEIKATDENGIVAWMLSEDPTMPTVDDKGWNDVPLTNTLEVQTPFTFADIE